MAKYGIKPRHPFERFWSKVRKAGRPEECLEWAGARLPEGYGFIYAGPLYDEPVRWIRAHRLSWEMHNGKVPEGLSVLHHCDNPPCVNPAHLYVGTQLENVRDRAVRRRGKEHRQNGTGNDNVKLTEADVRAIVAMTDAGKSQTVVAAMFGLTQPYVSKLARRQYWQHLWGE